MRMRTLGRWASRLIGTAFALMSFGFAVSALMAAQDFNWT
jgi:hypothetical protein